MAISNGISTINDIIIQQPYILKINKKMLKCIKAVGNVKKKLLLHLKNNPTPGRTAFGYWQNIGTSEGKH